jgi:hypothetical protein
MIWLLDKDPKVCAKYHADGDLEPAIKSAMKALQGRGKWGKWAYKRSQNYLWFYRLTEALVQESIDRNLLPYMRLYQIILDQLWQETPSLPCSPKGLKSKFPSYVTSKAHNRSQDIIHQWRKHYNETQTNSRWNRGNETPPWYYGDII